MIKVSYNKVIFKDKLSKSLSLKIIEFLTVVKKL